ncbi:bifunctional adenosylcobinamide kinase/adenosylcobinamide-phosphate guanylyltransferase [Gloeobacter kilaueensis]|uniref:Adenosylcobinamide kinase n=1 Tax=Gloeobacter kilaueensis (strain ATCC BAA-2537 / CCAP 1431/1 / ULC 316 / JS1) TaxID=1183438 RepID=U5QG70_GLOK1|nr:bifunctional adenosylcobinamide kinase/adenosylcobinamide-phosphate guanylyltransferase [Gloeobacter kilaueensis]AGY57916.1 adenosylcobinamide kinase/adenosylcobinamide-phosphate guanylyltransferase [Gloeobacter kilaueensis JS1]
MNPALILILGGARSGKSRFAERLASHYAGTEPVLYIATAQPSDPEMISRIERHQAERPAHWQTIECPRLLCSVTEEPLAPVILLDCLSVLVANWLLAGGDFENIRWSEADEAALLREVESLIDASAAAHTHLLIVSNEVGMGVVPPYPLGRLYRDVLGRLHQSIAERAERVYLLVAGLPVEIKSLAHLPFTFQ